MRWEQLVWKSGVLLVSLRYKPVVQRWLGATLLGELVGGGRAGTRPSSVGLSSCCRLSSFACQSGKDPESSVPRGQAIAPPSERNGTCSISEH